MRFKRMLLVLAFTLPCTALCFPGAAWSQMGGQPGDANGQQPVVLGSGSRMVRGTVTSTAADHLTLKTDAGDVYNVVITPNTQVRKGRDQVKFADVHSGDGIGAMGEVDAAGKTVHALYLQVVDAEQLKKAREAMGKTYISGTVTAINETKLTIKRSDDLVQVIEVDEDTSFKKGGRGMQLALGADGTAPTGGGRRGGATPPPDDGSESLTLADVKVGSVVAGPGELKKGTFVPKTLMIGEPGAQRQRRQGAGAGNGAGNGPASGPGAGTPPPTTSGTTTPPGGTEPNA